MCSDIVSFVQSFSLLIDGKVVVAAFRGDVPDPGAVNTTVHSGKNFQNFGQA